MGQFVGTWVYDSQSGLADTVRVLRLDVRDQGGVGWGASVGLGWTPTLEVRAAGTAVVLLTITGAWEDATEAAALFQVGAATSLVPTTGSADYEGQLVLTFPGSVGVMPSDDQADTYDFRVQRWP